MSHSYHPHTTHTFDITPQESIYVMDNSTKVYDQIQTTLSHEVKEANLEDEVDMLMSSPNSTTSSPGAFKYTRATTGWLSWKQNKTETVGEYVAFCVFCLFVLAFNIVGL